MRPTLRVLPLAALATLAGLSPAAVPERAPRLSDATRAVLAGGIDSLGRAHVAAQAAAEPAVLSRVPADVPDAALAARLRGTVTLRVRVSTAGLVDSVRALAGDPRLREAAAGSVRWWIFAPPARPAWTTVAIGIDGRQDADPLTPDVLAIGRDAERRGAWWEAVDASVGALQRLGSNPRLLNEWTIRERAIRCARHAPDRMQLPGPVMTACQNARGRQTRTLARSDHEEFVKTFDQALLLAPWFADGYQWRAASLLQCGRGFDAMRTLALFREAAADSAARSLANRAIARLATGDTLGTAQLLAREGRQFNLDEDADH